jgi:hypothetical protein
METSPAVLTMASVSLANATGRVILAFPAPISANQRIRQNECTKILDVYSLETTSPIRERNIPI